MNHIGNSINKSNGEDVWSITIKLKYECNRLNLDTEISNYCKFNIIGGIVCTLSFLGKTYKFIDDMIFISMVQRQNTFMTPKLAS